LLQIVFFTARSASNAHASTVKAKMRRKARVFGHFARGGEKCGLSEIRANFDEFQAQKSPGKGISNEKTP
jgi:hypothetical protein